MDENINPIIKLVSDGETMEMLSTLIAKMERLTFDENRTSIFRTSWGKNFFSYCMGLKDDRESFDIDKWYRNIVKKSGKQGRDIDPSLLVQPIEINWLTHLINLELKYNSESYCLKGSTLAMLHNILELEDSAHAKLAKYCKEERQYGNMGLPIYSNNSSDQKLLEAAPKPEPTPGSIEDLLGKNKK